VKKDVLENTYELPKEKQLTEQEIGKLSGIIETEKSLEMQKQHDLQLQQSLQKSRGLEIEI